LAERGFQTELWTDPFIQGLPPEAKLLFIYLWTNKHCNQAGLYEITLKTMSFDAGLPQESLPALLKQLEPKVTWYPEQNLIWVKNFLKRQCKSQSFLIAAVKSLKTIRNNGLVKEFTEYNQSFDLVPLYEDGGGTVLPLSSHSGNTVHNPVPVPSAGPGASAKVRGTGRKGVVKGGETGLAATTATETAIESELLGFLETLEGWRFGKADDLAWLRDFRQDWPDFDVPLAKACRDWHSGRTPPKHKGIWKNRFREWMRHERKREEERHGRTGEHRQDTIEAMRAEGWTESEPDEPGKAD